MTYAEAAYSMQRLPDDTYVAVYQAAEAAENEWSAVVPPISVLVAKAVSVEVTLIFCGALGIVEPIRAVLQRAQKSAVFARSIVIKGPPSTHKQL